MHTSRTYILCTHLIHTSCVQCIHFVHTSWLGVGLVIIQLFSDFVLLALNSSVLISELILLEYLKPELMCIIAGIEMATAKTQTSVSGRAMPEGNFVRGGCDVFCYRWVG